MDGLELCRQIRQHDFGNYVYIVLLTARDRRGNMLAGLTAGADDFISKPVDAAEVNARVRVAGRLLSLETRNLAIFALAKLAESRDPETGHHLERVQNYARVLAEHFRVYDIGTLKLDAAYVNLIYQTSPLHDIGKVAIPDSVLLKAGRLSDDEFDVMKTHTSMGAGTLEAAARQHPNAEFLWMAIDIAATHHERYDGTGYPKRLVGEQIPLCGRIVALADVYDALTSKRVYKPAFTHSNARSIIVEAKGKHFDPDVVDAFLANERQFIEIQERFVATAMSAAA